MNRTYPPSVFGEKATTWVPCVETILPFLSLCGGSMVMPTERAAVWMAVKSPDSPTTCGSMPLSQVPRAAGVSRAGSVVTNTTRSRSCSALGSCFLATAMLFIVSGQTSGQLV